MEHQIRFWRSVFADYSKYQVVVHDTIDLDRIYSVVDFTDLAAQGVDPIELDRAMKEETEIEVARLRSLFRRIAEGVSRDELLDDERRVYDLFASDRDPDRFLVAGDEKRLRTQRGIRERFEDGYRRARRFFPEMERIFREEGVPVELTRLPLIESCFNLEAYSKVGAAGVWQFMPSTGRLFMEVNDLIDERRDPITSTRAAARFLARTYDMLGSWPLAITAYNHGPGGMARAVRDVGTDDIAAIVREYKGPAFGFASRNFYAEFLAALDVDKHHTAWFGHVPDDPPPATVEHRLPEAVEFESAARLAGIDSGTLADLNPALMSAVVTGRRSIPGGYRLRIPARAGTDFDDRLAELMAETRVTRVSTPAPTVRQSRSKGSLLTHRVKKGQTLAGIAQRYSVSVEALRTANRMSARSSLKAGQVLRIPRRT
jgi:membrane-bound lytic murein transglycosylase D